ncbi:porin [uncultured Moraxella sp.]|uniref:porin n=1 Tax=uncultured Moraxella sp. TaxID=263769 RepID=UPI0025D09A90|nr:porin [uncultured Moraxella sp.]
MKKLVLATAVAALSITAAQAAPTVYGKAFLTVDYKDGDFDYTDRAGVEKTIDDSRAKLNSNASRIGFKGAEALTANTDLVYQLEYGVKVDENTQDEQFKARDTYIGLANKQYGTLLAGRLSSIDGNVDFANVTQGAVLGGDNVLASEDSPRANNAAAYISPSYNGLSFQGMYVMDENGADSLNGDAFGAAVLYTPEGQPFRGGVAYISASNGASNEKLSWLRVSGAYDVTPAFTLGALYQNTDYSGDDNENAYTVSGKYKTATPWAVYGQVDYVDNAGGVKGNEKQRYVVGGQYAFNKATTGHVYGAYLDQDVEAGTWAAHNDETKVFAKTGNYQGFGVGAGIEYKF